VEQRDRPNLEVSNRMFFCSYGREDSAFALQLAQHLRTAGVSLWIDQLDIVGGERWDEAIQKALASSDGVIVVVSPSSLNSQNVSDEISYALDEKKRVIPVLHRACDVPFRWRRLQRVDFTGSFETGLAALLRAIRSERSEPIAATADVAPGITSPPATLEAGPAPVAEFVPLARRRPHTTAGGLAGVIGAVVSAGLLIRFSPDDRYVWNVAMVAVICGLSSGVAAALCVLNRRRTFLALAVGVASAALAYYFSGEQPTDMWLTGSVFGLPGAAFGAAAGAGANRLFGWRT
jgi:hypothetical protein